jgi:hypothetical protein
VPSAGLRKRPDRLSGRSVGGRYIRPDASTGFNRFSDREMISFGQHRAIDEVVNCRAPSGRVVAAAEDWGLGWLATL